MEDSSQSRQHRMSLLLHGRKVAADTIESGGPSRTAKRSGNLLLHFCHAQIAFGLVVHKRNTQVVKPRQRMIGSLKQSTRAVSWPCFVCACLCLFHRRGRGWVLSGRASSQDLEIASDPSNTLDGGNRGLVEQTPLLTCFMQIEQEVLHLAGPRLLFLRGLGSTVSHQVGATGAVSTAIGIIARQSVVHTSTCKSHDMRNEIAPCSR